MNPVIESLLEIVAVDPFPAGHTIRIGSTIGVTSSWSGKIMSWCYEDSARRVVKTWHGTLCAPSSGSRIDT